MATHTDLTEQFLMRPHPSKGFKRAIQDLLAMETIADISQRIRGCIKEYGEQTSSGKITDDGIALLSEAQVALQIMQEMPVEEPIDQRRKQDAIIVNSDNIRGTISTLFCQSNAIEAPDAKDILDRFTQFGLDIVKQQTGYTIQPSNNVLCV